MDEDMNNKACQKDGGRLLGNESKNSNTKLQKLPRKSKMEFEQRILQWIKTSDLSEDMAYLADVLSLDVVKQLMLYAGGGRINIQKPTNITFKKIAITRYIEANQIIPDSVLIKKMCRYFDVSERFIMNLLTEIKK